LVIGSAASGGALFAQEGPGHEGYGYVQAEAQANAAKKKSPAKPRQDEMKGMDNRADTYTGAFANRYAGDDGHG